MIGGYSDILSRGVGAVGSVGGMAPYIKKKDGAAGSSKGSPFSFFMDNVRAGSVVFRFRAPSSGAVIRDPYIYASSVSGEIYAVIEVGGISGDPVKILSGPTVMEGEYRIDPFSLVVVSIAGDGEAQGVWIGYYA